MVSARTHLEMFAKHSHDYMYMTSLMSLESGKRACAPHQSVLHHQLITDQHGKDLLSGLSVSVSQPMIGSAAHH